MNINILPSFARVRCLAFSSILPTLLCLQILLTDTSAATPDVTYTYDAANRLVQVQYGDGAVIAYAYDAAGNRTQQTIFGPGNLQADYDGNGLPDLWEYRYFGFTGVSPSGDPDTDGLSNSNELAFGSSPILKNTDGDPQDDYAEWIADTNPTNAASYFQLTAISGTPPVRVFFLGSSNRVYTLHSAANLMPGGWTNVPGQTRITGNGTTSFLTDTNAAAARYYRVRVELP